VTLIYFFDYITQVWISKDIGVGIESLTLVGILLLSITIGNFYSSFLLGSNKLIFMGITVSIALVCKLIILLTSENIKLDTVVTSSLVAYMMFILLSWAYIKVLIYKKGGQCEL